MSFSPFVLGVVRRASAMKPQRSALGSKGVRTIVITNMTILRPPDTRLGKRPSGA
jgi:hypothetical protein